MALDLLDDRLDDDVALGEVVGSVVTRSREGSAPSILAQAATTFSSARQAEASLRASRIVSAVVVETAARPLAIAPLPAIAGLSYPCWRSSAGFLSRRLRAEA